MLNYVKINAVYVLFFMFCMFHVALSCSVSEDCKSVLPGALCLDRACVCPQGYLPDSSGRLSCFQSATHLGDSCNTSYPCGNDLMCVNSSCQCPEGFQLFQAHGINLCLLWLKPIRLVDRCRSNEDCQIFDHNMVCRKRWCQCRNGFQLFETMLFGLKHRCFKTYRKTCRTSSHCTKVTSSADQHCVCHHSYCHCMSNTNISALDMYSWEHDKLSYNNPSYNPMWKKDIVLATRLLFITIILFFVPCFVYVTRFVYISLGVKDHARGYFSGQPVRPLRSSAPEMRHMRSRSPSVRPHRRAVYVPATHCVEIPMSTCTHRVPDELGQVPNRPTTSAGENVQASANTEHKAEDLPPSYEEVMHFEQVQSAAPPPAYTELNNTSTV